MGRHSISSPPERISISTIMTAPVHIRSLEQSSSREWKEDIIELSAEEAVQLFEGLNPTTFTDRNGEWSLGGAGENVARCLWPGARHRSPRVQRPRARRYIPATPVGAVSGRASARSLAPGLSPPGSSGSTLHPPRQRAPSGPRGGHSPQDNPARHS